MRGGSRRSAPGSSSRLGTVRPGRGSKRSWADGMSGCIWHGSRSRRLPSRRLRRPLSRAGPQRRRTWRGRRGRGGRRDAPGDRRGSRGRRRRHRRPHPHRRASQRTRGRAPQSSDRRRRTTATADAEHPAQDRREEGQAEGAPGPPDPAPPRVIQAADVAADTVRRMATTPAAPLVGVLAAVAFLAGVAAGGQGAQQPGSAPLRAAPLRSAPSVPAARLPRFERVTFDGLDASQRATRRSSSRPEQSSPAPGSSRGGRAARAGSHSRPTRVTAPRSWRPSACATRSFGGYVSGCAECRAGARRRHRADHACHCGPCCATRGSRGRRHAGCRAARLRPSRTRLRRRPSRPCWRCA